MFGDKIKENLLKYFWSTWIFFTTDILESPYFFKTVLWEILFFKSRTKISILHWHYIIVFKEINLNLNLQFKLGRQKYSFNILSFSLYQIRVHMNQNRRINLKCSGLMTCQVCSRQITTVTGVLCVCYSIHFRFITSLDQTEE